MISLSSGRLPSRDGVPSRSEHCCPSKRITKFFLFAGKLVAGFELRFQDLLEKLYIYGNTLIIEGAPEEKMKRMSFAIATLVLTSTFYLALTILPKNAEATTLYVGGGGPGNYTKIQDAITASSPGDSVFVYSGVYNEDVSVYKPLSLIGEDEDTTIIRGSGTADTVLVTSDGVKIIGFSVENSGFGIGLSGIRLFAVQNCNVTDNSVYGNDRGISLWVAFNNVVENNNVTNNENGIHLFATVSHSNLIANNEIWNNSAGIYVDGSYSNTITGNIITNNDYGIYLLSSSYNAIYSNLMVGNGVFISGSSVTHWNTHIIGTSNTVNGKSVHYWKNVTGGSIPLGTGQVILANSSNIVINNQNVSNGSVGIEVGFSSHISIMNSTSSSNSQDGIHIYNSDNMTITDSITSNNGNDGISIDNSITNTLTDNTASSNGANGLHLFASDFNTIANNDIFLNGPPVPASGVELCAIYLGSSNHSVIAENSVLSNSNCAFSLVNSDVNNIYDNNFSNNAKGVYYRGASGNRFTNNTVHGNVVVSITLSASSHNVFAFNTVTHHLYGMSFVGSHDNTVVGNHISAEHDEFRLGGITISASTSHVLANNVMVGDGLVVDGSDLAHWNTHVIDTSNTLNGRPVRYWKNVTGGSVPLGASEVILANCSDVAVEYQNLDTGTAGIELGFSINISVSNNTVTGSKRSIFLYSSDGNAIAGNAVSFSDLLGIDLRLSNRNTIFHNNLWANQDGVGFRDSDNNSVTENNIWQNTRSGISIGPDVNFGPGSDDNTIINNTVFSNRDGIKFYQSYNNNISQNSFVNNLNGVHVLDAGGNRIHHNNFIDNTQQAYDDGSTNQWDDGYPSGGNFWSDYYGVDIFNGPNQDIPGSDWIGDTPYVIDFDSEDKYPLMGPSGTFPPSAPLNLSAFPGNQQITLTWDPPYFDGASPITNYRIYRGTIPGGEIFHAQVGAVLTYQDTGLTNGQLYCYRVSAVNGVGEGPLSNEACTAPTTTPGAPTILRADLSGNDLENVTVEWNLSSDDGAGQDSVIRYSIFRGTTYDVNAIGYQLIATVPKGTIEFNDNLAGEGNPNNYFYRLCAVDLNNLTNCSVSQAGKFTRLLSNGPNLVSIPLVQPNESIETVLQTLKWDEAWSYDPLLRKWKSHMTFKPYNGELRELNISMGIWVNVTEQSNLTVAGKVPSSTTVYLHAGWNLVGFPSFNVNYAVSDLKASVGAESIEGFDAFIPPYFLRALTDGDVLQAGYGYWVKVAGDTSWVIASS
jgi:parallel beta-helix repeat protein